MIIGVSLFVCWYDFEKYNCMDLYQTHCHSRWVLPQRRPTLLLGIVHNQIWINNLFEGFFIATLISNSAGVGPWQRELSC